MAKFISAEKKLENQKELERRVLEGNRLLEILKMSDQEAVLKAALEGGLSPHGLKKSKVQPLLVAVGKIGYVKLLLEFGANPNQKNIDGLSPLVHAIFLRQEEVAELLIERGADVNDNGNLGGRSLLYWTILRGLERLTKLLIEKGVDVNHQDAQGNTILHLLGKETLDERAIKACELLLNAGANLHIKNRYNESIHNFYKEGSVMLHMIEATEEMRQLEQCLKDAQDAQVAQGGHQQTVNAQGLEAGLSGGEMRASRSTSTSVTDTPIAKPRRL